MAPVTQQRTQEEPTWFRLAFVCAQLHQWEAMLHIYYPVYLAHCRARTQKDLQPWSQQILTSAYSRWYSDNHEQDVDAIRRQYDFEAETDC